VVKSLECLNYSSGPSDKQQKRWLTVTFKYYLLITLFLAAPVILKVDAILFKPFLSGLIKRQKQYYSGVNQSGSSDGV
jgi:hypothetical protein